MLSWKFEFCIAPSKRKDISVGNLNDGDTILELVEVSFFGQMDPLIKLDVEPVCGTRMLQPTNDIDKVLHRANCMPSPAEEHVCLDCELTRIYVYLKAASGHIIAASEKRWINSVSTYDKDRVIVGLDSLGHGVV